MPTPKPEPPPEADNPEQSRRFIDMARTVEVDETPGALDPVIERVIQPSRNRLDRRRREKDGRP